MATLDNDKEVLSQMGVMAEAERSGLGYTVRVTVAGAAELQLLPSVTVTE